MTVIAILFWLSAGLLVYTHLGYTLLLAGIARLPRRVRTVVGAAPDDALPAVTVIVAAYAEQDVIARAGGQPPRAGLPVGGGGDRGL